MDYAYIFDESSISDLREVAQVLSSDEPMRKARLEELTDFLALALGRCEASREHCVAAAIAQTAVISAGDHARLPADQRRWQMSQQGCGGLARLNAQLATAPCTRALRDKVSEHITDCLRGCAFMSSEQADIAAQILREELLQQRERGG